MKETVKINSGLAKKILLWLFLLIVFLSLYAWWKLHRAERSIEILFQTALVPTDSTSGVTIQNVDISPLNGYIRFNKPVYYSKNDSMQVSFQSATIFIGRWPSIQMALLPVQFVLNRLDHTKLTFRKLTLSSGQEISSEIEIDLFGNPLQLYPIITNEFPGENLRITARADSVTNDFIAFFIPQSDQILSNLDSFMTLNAEMEISPSTNAIQLIELQLKDTNTEILLNGSIRYDQLVSIREPGYLDLQLQISDITKNSENYVTQIELNRWGRLKFQEANWQYNASFNDSITDFSSIQFSDGSNNASLSNVTIYPNAGQLGQIEQALILFGVPTNQFNFREANVSFNRPNQNVINIEASNLIHSNFMVSFSGNLNTLDGKVNETTSISGNLRISNLSDGLQNVAANAEFILGMPLRRQGRDIIFNVSGTLGRPQFR